MAGFTVITEVREREQFDAVKKVSEEHSRVFVDLEKHTISLSRLERFANELHSYLVAISSGIPMADLKTTRYIPIRIYLSEYDDHAVDQVSKAVIGFAEELHFGLLHEYEAEPGSWFKRWIFRSKELMTQPEVVDRLKKGERALELATLRKYQAEVDKTLSEAASAVLQSLQPVSEAAVQIGSVVIIKVSGAREKSQVFVRTLTQPELILLEENPTLLKNPSALLHSLQGSKKDIVEADEVHWSVSLPSPEHNETSRQHEKKT